MIASLSNHAFRPMASADVPTKTLEDLGGVLRRIDGRGYPSYRQIRGAYYAAGGRLIVDDVQGDPFAEPSRLRVVLPASTAGLPDWALKDETARVAAADFLNRMLCRMLDRIESRRGSGRSGELRALRPGQEVLARSSVTVYADGRVEARFRAGLPARGRTVLGHQAAELLCEDVPAAVSAALHYSALDGDALRRQVDTVEDARALRAQLTEHGLVAFVADGAVLPRRSGVDDRLLENAVPFRVPEKLRVTLRPPNAGDVSGMGVRAGVTLIVGGGFHGKSTLLRALERGVYDHVPDDGRERVVAVASAVKVRAEDGRSVAGVDIGNFIDRLPGGIDTRHFSTSNASGSTSQAAAIAEALELGATCLLLDEDTSATNFMIRDARMQALVHGEHEPITPFIDRARQLFEEHGVSTILVVGGSGDFFDVADTVIAMTDYVPSEVTAQAREVAASHPTQRAREGGPWRPAERRIPLPRSLDPRRGRRAVHVRAFSEERVLYGGEDVDLRAVEQLVEPAQARAIAQAIVHARGGVINGECDVAAALHAVIELLERDGLDAFQDQPTGELAAFRVFELGAFLGRIRGLEVRPITTTKDLSQERRPNP